jgi:oligopeptidase A
LGQSAPLYRALEALRESPAYAELDAAGRRVLEVLVRDARLSGVGLAPEPRARFARIQSELAELGTRFANQVLDDTRRFALTLSEPEDVAGLPKNWRALSAQAAREEGEDGATPETGPWRLTLDAPSLLPFLSHARRRDLRERLYRAYITRASEGDSNNRPLIEQILALRREQAELLGFASYAELSLASKMAGDVAAVETLLEELRGASYDAAHLDLAALAARAAASGASEAADLKPWDIAFWTERLREERFDYSEEDLRPYFPLPRVLAGLFALSERLFGVEIRGADGEAPVYHKDVRFFRVYERGGQAIAAFYLDPYARPSEKRGGAWMADCLGRRRLGGSIRHPVAFLVCNQTPPVGDAPSLMSFDEVTTLFHEFGHGLQHMLTAVECGLVSGIQKVEWDAVELPSQFMENWCYHRETVRGISGHVESGAALPDELFDKLCAARTFRAGSDMLRQIYFGMTDLELHHRYRGGGEEDAFDIQRRIAERTTVIPPLPEDRFLCSFGHIFGGGYAAGYYSYKWAEVLSADAFGAFEEADLDDADAIARVGRRFRDTVLARGGSQPPSEVFAAFRGREATPEALLRHSGLQGSD